MANTSRYYQINEFILLEYIYADSENPETYNTDEDNIFIMRDSDFGRNYFFSSDSQEDTFQQFPTPHQT